MALIIEDGSLVSNANSLVTRVDYIAYALTLGTTIADDEAADVQLVKAMVYINSKESQLKGSKVDRDQPVSFPRYNLFIDGYSWGSTEIPTQAKLLQYHLALDINAGIDPYNPKQSASVGIKRKKIDGAVEVEYATKEQESRTIVSMSNSLLKSLIKYTGISILMDRR